MCLNELCFIHILRSHTNALTQSEFPNCILGEARNGLNVFVLRDLSTVLYLGFFVLFYSFFLFSFFTLQDFTMMIPEFL